MYSKLALFFLTTIFGVVLADPRYSGFTTYTQVTEGADNSGAIAYSPPFRSTTLFVNVQISPNGGSHTSLFNDFRTMCTNYGNNNISLIPRLRYGTSDPGNALPEPTSIPTIQADVKAWADVINSLTDDETCDIPIVQAGTLGVYGEWHDGPYCMNQGLQSSATSKQVKVDVVQALMETDALIAIRTPRDHSLVAASLTDEQQERLVVHDDCILAQGPSGSDTGTFVDGDGMTAAQWKQYTIDIGLGFGGEPCEDTSSSGYNWNDTATVCSSGPNGLVSYINQLGIAYLNPLNPPQLAAIFRNNNLASCVQSIQDALQSHD